MSSLSTNQRQPSGRGRAALAADWFPRSLPPGTATTPVTLIAHDGDVSRGILYERATTSTVVTLMHPRNDLHRARQVIDLLEAGLAVWTQNGRDVNNDLRLVHESALLDVAAGMEWLRERGFERIMLLGISGGASLYGYYTEQALTAPGQRIERQPAGRRTGFADAPMPPPDGLVLFAPHPGQGRLLLGMIDPSVTDESDPLSHDPELDPYSPANGFVLPPGQTRYTEDFIARYRAAQADRVRRIDSRAREIIGRQRSARARYKESGDAAAMRESLATPILTTYRTDADLRCSDLTLEPTDRPYGSIISPQPHVSNYGVVGFGRLTTPEAWLSTWSGLSSHAALARSAAGIAVPTMLVEFTGDQSVFPSDVRAVLDALATPDKTHVRIRGTHFGEALSTDEEPGGAIATRSIIDWIASHS